MAELNMNYTERKISHFKMYKVKKQWLFTGMGFLAMSGTLLFGSVSVKADTTQSTGSSVTTTQVGVTTSDDALNQTTTEPNGTKSDNKLQTTGTDKEGTQVPDDTANSIGSAEPGSTDDAVVSNPATDTASKTDETAETTPTVSTPTTAGTMQRRVMLRKQAAVKQAAPTAATDIPDGDADSATNAKQDYLDYATGEYATAMTNYQTQSDAINTQIAAYQASKDAYDSALADYQNELASFEQDTTSDKTDQKTQLSQTYTVLENQYQQLQTQLATINTAVTVANAAYDEAYATLQTKYEALPQSVQNAGTEIKNYNEAVSDQAASLVAEATTKAYVTALSKDPTTVSTTVNEADSIAKNATEKIIATSDTTSDGSVTATLFGKTYTDTNGDGQITYEDDVIPIVISDLKADLSSITDGNLTSVKGSYPEIVVLFNYLKQVADTSLPYETTDGTVGRVESGEANNGSNVLSQYGSKMASSFSSNYASELLSTIDGTKAQLEATLKNIYGETGNTFDEASFNQTFDDTLKQVAIQIYTDQTDAIISMAENLKSSFDNADAADDSLWQTNTLYVAPTKLAQQLQDAIDTAKQNADTGLATLKTMPASDDFLSLAYSTGDAADGLDTNATINGIWTGLYDTIDWFGTTVSPLMKNLVSISDPNSIKDKDGNVTFSADFVAQHAVVFDAATALANTVTQLVVKSGEITNDLQGVLTDLLTVSGDFAVTQPEKTQLFTTITDEPEAPSVVKSADLVYRDDTDQLTTPTASTTAQDDQTGSAFLTVTSGSGDQPTTDKTSAPAAADNRDAPTHDAAAATLAAKGSMTVATTGMVNRATQTKALLQTGKSTAETIPQKQAAKTLPQTNEHQATTWTLLGLVLLSFLSALGMTSKRRQH
ncbi:hypothetical protein TY91_00175 [Secundilactobacillus collinoides]|uniref:Gram-positive cocci surface proteins LPxTG domain-containing protein n=2 Tax=Secundilactobacillus collinoides TaxID=33960 RepID=A0A161VLN3_SECCO|nr:hypothetical protein TY91_00175 [Secundilactobacillus collinoides]